MSADHEQLTRWLWERTAQANGRPWTRELAAYAAADLARSVDGGLRQRVEALADYCQQSARELGWAHGDHYLDVTLRLRAALDPPTDAPCPATRVDGDTTWGCLELGDHERHRSSNGGEW